MIREIKAKVVAYFVEPQTQTFSQISALNASVQSSSRINMTTNLLGSGKISPLIKISSIQLQHNKPLLLQKLASSPLPDSVKKVIYNPPQKSTVKIEEISENYLPRKKLIMDTIVSDDEMPTKNNQKQNLFAIPGNMPSQSLKPIHSSSNSLQKCN